MKSKILASLILAAMIGPTFTFADEDNHVPVGSRPKSYEALQPSMNPFANDENLPVLSMSQEEETCGFLFDKYPPVYYSSAIHWLVAVSALGDSAELEDGSVWKISSYDGYKALNWRSNDPLMITQNTRWFSKFDYKIVNKNTGAAIEANLYLGPIKNGEHTRYIIAIDSGKGQLMLSDNSHWEISSYDTGKFRDWALSDAIIIGYNSGWDSGCESILINVNMNNFIRAKQF